jgi:hypothetical protein
MNALDDDIRTVLHRQSAEMHVPDRPPVDELALADVGSRPPRPGYQWLLPAAAVVLVALGGLALAQRRTADDAGPNPAAEQPAAAFTFDTPTVRLTAQQVEVLVGDQTFVPPAGTTAYSDPGNPEHTTLELSWSDTRQDQRLFITFESDGASWWANTIRTYDANGEWLETAPGQRWFESPLGSAWTGDLNLPNVRIADLTIEAFLRPASCDNPAGPLAVVAAYPTIEGVAGNGNGFGGRVDLIDTSTCAPIDPTPYTFMATSADPTVAEVLVYDQPFGSTTTIAGGSPEIAEEGEPEMYGRFDLVFRNAGETTVQVTVTDSAGTVIGTVTMPVVVRPPDPAVAPDTTVTESGVERIPAGSVVCVIAGASARTAQLCTDELGGAIVVSPSTSTDSFVMPVDPASESHVIATANVGNLLDVEVRALDASWLPAPATDAAQVTYLVLGADEGPYAG